jgi:hypothetical protein
MTGCGPPGGFADRDAALLAFERDFAEAMAHARRLAAAHRQHGNFADFEREVIEPAYRAAQQIEDEIRRTPCRSLVGAAVKLRRLLDPDLGLFGAGEHANDRRSLAQILDWIETATRAPDDALAVTLAADLPDPVLALIVEEDRLRDEGAALQDKACQIALPLGAPEILQRRGDELVEQANALFERIAVSPARTRDGLAAQIEVLCRGAIPDERVDTILAALNGLCC